MIYPFVAILPSAGVGRRFKSDKPKQYSLIDNKTVMEISLEPLLDFSECLGICIPVAPEDTHWKSIESLDNPKINFIKGVSNSKKISGNELGTKGSGGSSKCVNYM